MARQTTCRPMSEVWTGVGGWAIAGGILAAVGAIGAAVTIALALLHVSFVTLNAVTIGIAAGVLIASLLGLIAELTHIRNYFFDGKLGCIAEEECGLGQVWIIEDNEDGDVSLNLILAPARDTTTLAEYRAMSQPARLIFHDPGVATVDPAWQHKPEAMRLGSEPTGQFTAKLPYFHCEIEGSFFDDWSSALIAYMWVLIGFATALLAIAIAGAVSGPIGWIVVAAVALLLLLALAFGLLPGSDDEFTTEAGPVGTATPGPGGPIVTDSGGSTISVGDFVVVLGRHVVDTGHSGEGCWNELHPLRAVAKVTSAEYEIIADTPAGHETLGRYCQALSDFRDPTGTIRQELTCSEHPAVG